MFKDSLFAKYLKERQGIEVLETQYGFITYKLNNEECFIVDMCVESLERRQGHGLNLIDELESIARSAGAKILSANIHLWDENINQTIMAALCGGFSISRAEQNIILVTKKIEVLNGK